MQIKWKTNIFESPTTVGWATTPAWCWGNRMLFTSEVLHHNSLNSHFVNEFPALLPNSYSPWSTWWVLQSQINLGIFSNPQGYLKPIKPFACNHRTWSISGSCRALCRGRRTQFTCSVVTSACFKLILQDQIDLVYTTSSPHKKGLCKWEDFSL